LAAADRGAAALRDHELPRVAAGLAEAAERTLPRAAPAARVPPAGRPGHGRRAPAAWRMATRVASTPDGVRA